MKIKTARIENYPLVSLSCHSEHLQKYIIYLGVMSTRRGILEALKAFSLVSKTHPEWKFYLIGDIKPRNFAKEINELIFKLKIEEKVKLIPSVPYEEKEKYSSQASIGIVTFLPFANKLSCLPNKMFDYMLVGLPVIASNFFLYKEVIEGNNCGLCVDPTSPKEIAKAIEYLIEHPEEARKMGENGRKAILEKYNWENEGKKLLKIYKELTK